MPVMFSSDQYSGSKVLSHVFMIHDTCDHIILEYYLCVYCDGDETHGPTYTRHILYRQAVLRFEIFKAFSCFLKVDISSNRKYSMNNFYFIIEIIDNT